MNRRRELTVIEQTRPCTLCGARPGGRCTNPSGSFYATGVHAARETAGASRPAEPTGQYGTRRQQLTAYFYLLIEYAEKTEDKQRRDGLFDRIERIIAAVEAEDAKPVPCGLGWPS